MDEPGKLSDDDATDDGRRISTTGDKYSTGGLECFGGFIASRDSSSNDESSIIVTYSDDSSLHRDRSPQRTSPAFGQVEVEHETIVPIDARKEEDVFIPWPFFTNGPRRETKRFTITKGKKYKATSVAINPLFKPAVTKVEEKEHNFRFPRRAHKRSYAQEKARRSKQINFNSKPPAD